MPKTAPLPPHLKEMSDRFTKLHVEAEEIREKYKGSKEDMPGDETERWEKILDDADALGAELDREMKFHRITSMASEITDEVKLYGDPSGGDRKEFELQLKAFERALKQGEKFQYTEEELKALNLSSPPSGGYLAAPEYWVNQLLKDVDDATFMRTLGTVYNLVDASSLGCPTMDSDVDDSDWIGENEAITYSEMTFGKRELKPLFSGKGVKISRALIMKSALPIEQIVRQRLAYKFGITEEKAFLTGNGINKPLGVFTASASGISSGRDIDVATAGQINTEDLFNIFFGMKSAYAERGTWFFHRDFQKVLRKFKDAAGNYLWQPFDMPGRQLTGGNPGSVMGRPYVVSEFAPGQTSNAWVDAQYLLCFGDFSYYWIAQCMAMEMQALVEKYAEENQIAYIGRMWVDGMPVNELAFRRLVYQA